MTAAFQSCCAPCPSCEPWGACSANQRACRAGCITMGVYPACGYCARGVCPLPPPMLCMPRPVKQTSPSALTIWPYPQPVGVTHLAACAMPGSGRSTPPLVCTGGIDDYPLTVGPFAPCLQKRTSTNIVFMCLCRYAEVLREAHDAEHLTKFEELLEAAMDLDRIPDEYLVCASYNDDLQVQLAVVTIPAVRH